MPLDEKSLEGLLADDSLENVPAKMRGAGLTGPRAIVSVAEQRDRRETLSQLLAAGMSRDFITKRMGIVTNPDGTPGFAMTPDAVTLLVGEVYETWAEEDVEDRPHVKAAAVRRIKRAIARASAKHNYAAVAQLERTLSMIEGTAEPIEIKVSGMERVSIAIQQVLNVQSPEALKALADEGRRFIEDNSETKPVLIPGEVVDATSE